AAPRGRLSPSPRPRRPTGGALLAQRGGPAAGNAGRPPARLVAGRGPHLRPGAAVSPRTAGGGKTVVIGCPPAGLSRGARHDRSWTQQAPRGAVRGLCASRTLSPGQCGDGQPAGRGRFPTRGAGGTSLLRGAAPPPRRSGARPGPAAAPPAGVSASRPGTRGGDRLQRPGLAFADQGGREP